jgi:hypothetical protein
MYNAIVIFLFIFFILALVGIYTGLFDRWM